MIQEKTLRFGIVDVGTNAVRFEIYESTGATLRRIYQRREIFRLGDELATSGRMNAKAMPAVLKAFEEFARLARQQKLHSIRAAGTSVFREASDGAERAADIFQSSGIEIEIISGEREAQLIAKGILAFEQNLQGSLLFVDIGGGSTEISFSEASKVAFSASLPIGAIRLQNEILQTHPPSSVCCKQLREYSQQQLQTIPFEKLHKDSTTAVCSSGTARALALLAQDTNFDTAWLNKLIVELRPLNKAALLAYPGMKKERHDLLLAGALLLEEILKAASIKNIRVSEFSLRHGLVVESAQAAGL